MTTQYFWLNQSASRGGYSDDEGELYHYRGGIPGSKQLSEGDRFVYYRPGEYVIFGTGRIGTIKTEHEGASGRPTEYYARIEEYRPIDPPIRVREIKDDIPFLRDRGGLSGVPQSGIRRINEAVFDRILAAEPDAD